MGELTRFERGVRTFDRYLTAIEKSVSAVLFLGVLIIVLAGVIMRFVLKIPNMYGEELSRYLLIGSVFIGISIGVRQKSHMGIDSIVKALPAGLSKKVQFTADLLTAFVYAVLTVQSFRFVSLVKGFGQKSSGMTFLPMYLVYGMLLAGFLLATLRAVMMLWNDYIARNQVLSDSAGGQNQGV